MQTLRPRKNSMGRAMRKALWLAGAWLCVALCACDGEEAAPSVKATCTRLEDLCGELYGFEAAQCEAVAEVAPRPTPTERRCVGEADTCEAAMLCQLDVDGGLPDGGTGVDPAAAEAAAASE